VTDHPAPDVDRTIQLLVDSDGDRDALTQLLSTRYTVVTDQALQPADCYLVGDRLLPQYEAELTELKAETDPTFLPVLLLQRTEESGRQWLPEENPTGPPLVDETVTAPIDRVTLYRRLQNLLIRREQSAELAADYEAVQHRFERLFEASNDAIFVIDIAEGIIADCNPAACALVGYDYETLQSMSPTEVLSADDPDALTAFLDEVYERGEGWVEELTCLSSDGDTRHVECSAATIDIAASPLILVSARDITERKAYQQELELNTTAMDGAPVGISISDPDQEDNPMIYVNEGFEEITGYSAEETVGRNCRFLQGPDTREEPVAAMRRAIDTEQPVAVELRNYRKDGTMFWNRVTIAPVENDDGEVTHFIGFQEDITERKEREQRLQLFQKAVDSSANAVLLTDADGTIEYVNPAFEAQSGYTAAEVDGLTPHVLNSGRQDEAFYEELWVTISAGETWEADLVNQRKSGELYQVHQQITSITDEDGEITHFVAVESDVTQRRLREQQLAVLNRILRHNLRNGLNVIDGNLTLLAEAVDDAQLQQFIDAMAGRVAELERVGDRAATVRALFDQEKSDDAVYAVTDLMADVAETVDQRYPDATLHTDAGGLAVKADTRLKIALVELVDSIMTHSDAAVPEVTITATPGTDTRAAEWVEIAVDDNGPGVPDYEWEAIKAGTETPLEHGTGLGLWLVHWTISLLGGEVEIETDGSGTRAVLTLPRADLSASDDDTDAADADA